MKETKTKIYYSSGSRASGKTQSIIERLKEENESLHQAFNEQYKQNEELIKINHQLGKEKEELLNDIGLYQAELDDLKLENYGLKHIKEEKDEIIIDLKDELKELKTILSILQRFNFKLCYFEDNKSDDYAEFYLLYTTSTDKTDFVEVDLSKEEYEFLKKYEGKKL